MLLVPIQILGNDSTIDSSAKARLEAILASYGREDDLNAE